MSSGSSTKNPSLSVVRRPRWIINPIRDLLLFVATPALILPAFLLADSRWSVEEIALFVFAFGQIGHQLPSLMRAYGDRALFHRHRTRFIVAPLALLSVSFLFLYWNLHGLILVAAVWGIWHALMQTYGMMRIYDAKAGCFTLATRRLDFAMCLCWFGLPVLLSKWRLVTLLDMFFVAGGPLSVAAAIQPIQLAWIAATAIVTVLFLLNLVRTIRVGSPVNPVKLLLCVTSFGFFWYTNMSISNVILGLVMFEVFHDVQYLAIVWIYNRNQVENGSEVGGFTKFLFRRSGALIGLYVGTIFAFGSLHYLEQLAPQGGIKFLLTGFLATTGLLHYYYDGFIWKIRERQTSKNLKLDQHTTPIAKTTRNSSHTMHLAKWSIFALLACWLFVSERHGTASKLERYQALRQAVPDSPLVRLELGSEFHLQGRLDEAAAEYRATIQADPNNAKAYNNLGLVLLKSGRVASGVKCFEKSLDIDPKQSYAHNNLGNAYSELGNYGKSATHFVMALEAAPNDVNIHNNFALMFARAGRFAEAEEHFREAIAIDAEHSATHYNLATVLARQKRYRLAGNHYRAAIRLDSQNVAARRKLEIIEKILRHNSDKPRQLRPVSQRISEKP